ncbi:MAG: sulfite exporter TauE/SafE family protein [Oscillospiraceae bacterium]|nr:sulfite exporter TauE/SafE family protein [Oscillospiraceae bacterium]
MYIVAAIIVFIATLIGAIFGIGGGIIIKPAMEAITGLPLAYINALSGITVLCMAVISLFRYLKSGAKLNLRILWMSVGAVAGGFLGKYLFDLMKTQLADRSARVLQCALLIGLLIFTLFKQHIKSFNVQSAVMLIASGLFMGTLSAFLGIGGGPINLLIIYIIFSIDAKQAAVYSVFVILCSQIATVIFSTVTGGYAGMDMRLLYTMIPAAIAGGFIGPILHKKWDLKRFEVYYNYLLYLLIALNIYNIVRVIWFTS